MKAEIVAVELSKTKAGSRAVKIVLRTEDGAWLRDFIGENAPSFVVGRYWKLLDAKYGWTAFASEYAFDLVGLKVEIETEEGDYGDNVTEVKLAGATTNAGIIDDDIPF